MHDAVHIDMARGDRSDALQIGVRRTVVSHSIKQFLHFVCVPHHDDIGQQCKCPRDSPDFSNGSSMLGADAPGQQGAGVDELTHPEPACGAVPCERSDC